MVSSPATVTVALTPFEQYVKRALRLYDSPERLGQESPLASAYFLSHALRAVPRPVTARARGEMLCAELRAAAAQLWIGPLPASREAFLAAVTEVRRDPDDPRYAYVVLELRCFQTYITPYRTSDIWEQPHLLPGSKSQHYRDFDAAVKRLAALLLDRLRPAVRAERPRPPEVLYGYDQQLAALSAALARGATVTLQGAGGVGKTSISAVAVQQLGPERAFWYTLRPGFNDGPSSLLFALGAFLVERGGSNLWQYLVTANGVINDLNLALGLIREDLAGFGERPPILCFDDLEHLQTSGLSLLPQPHAQLLDLIDGLRDSAPLLLISQRPLPPGELNLELGGLSIADLEQFWHAAGRQLSRQQAEQLHRYTGGNPRLLTLLLALHQQDEELLPEDGDPRTFRSLLPAFQRMWRRLSAEERRALQRLAVYSGQVPEDVLPPAVLESLARLRLIERDGDGGVALLPVLVPVLRQDLAPDLREAFHREAAIVRLERGEYTAAAYHFVQGGQEDHAVQLWFPVRQQAIARGEADTARRIFSSISRHRLEASERKALDIIRAELHRLAGHHEEGLRELEQVDWSDASEASARLWTLRGEMQEALGYPDEALTSYAQGLQVTTRLLGRLAALQQARGLLFRRRRHLAQSWQEVRRAELALEQARGRLREAEGDHKTALDAYFRTRELAEELDDDGLRALAEHLIAGVYGRRQQLQHALEHASRAIAIYERLNDRVKFEEVRGTLAFFYVQARQFQSALEVGLPAYSFFISVKDTYYASMIAANLAEACYELGDSEAARRYAEAVLEFGHRFVAPYAHFSLGQVSRAQHDLPAAEMHFKEASELARRNEDFYMVAYAQRALADLYLARGATKEARQLLLDALALFRQFEIPGEISACEDRLAELQAQQV